MPPGQGHLQIDAERFGGSSSRASVLLATTELLRRPGAPAVFAGRVARLYEAFDALAAHERPVEDS